MSKKFSALIALLLGLLLTTSALAYDLGQLSFGIKELPATSGLIINQEGKGDALIFPYYDVRVINGKEQETWFCIINEETADTEDVIILGGFGGIAAKIRFREWDKSEEVWDAEIWLSKADVWCAAITRNAVSGYAKITSTDYVVVAGEITDLALTLGTPLSGGFDFLWPTGYPAISSNRMGYFEVIGSELTAAKIIPGSSPPKVSRQFWDCPNTLMGYAYIVRVADGVAAGYRATAIANFSRSIPTLYSGPGKLTPNLRDSCEDTLDELEFVLSKEDLFAGYSVEAGIGGQFSLIMTFPTKHFHFQGRPYYSKKTDVLVDGLPMTPPWTVDAMNKLEPITITIYDRLENKIPGNWWSPPGSGAGFPYEVTILGLYKGTPPTLPADNYRDNVAVSTSGYETGWIWVLFPNFGDIQFSKLSYFNFFGNVFSRYYGLPVIALWMQEFQNGALGGWYGEIIPAFYEVDWVLGSVT